MEQLTACSFASLCSGCSDWTASSHEIRTSKIQQVEALLSKVTLTPSFSMHWIELPDRGLRDRLDFRYENGQLGLLNPQKDAVTDLPTCLQLSPKLQNWLSEFRSHPLPISTRGSLRLRVAPDGQKGLWLDFPHTAIQALFQEKNYLEKMLQIAWVEIGQRRKRLEIKNGRLSLTKKSQLHAWSQSFYKETPLPIYHHVADFSQIGHQSNAAILSALTLTLKKIPSETLSTEHWAEFGCGAGNLSFCLLPYVKHLDAYEVDRDLLEGFKQTLDTAFTNNVHIHEKISLHAQDAQKNPASLCNISGVLLNPPRSGVKNFLAELKDSKVRRLIYLSCYPESWIQDMGGLESGWQCETVYLIDQFPHTQHLEILSSWIFKGK